MRQFLSRSEICNVLGLSRSHLIRKLTKFGLKPIEHAGYDRKKLYLVADIEKAFNIKINEEKPAKGGGLVAGTPEKNEIEEIEDILKD